MNFINDDIDAYLSFDANQQNDNVKFESAYTNYVFNQNNYFNDKCSQDTAIKNEDDGLQSSEYFDQRLQVKNKRIQKREKAKEIVRRKKELQNQESDVKTDVSPQTELSFIKESEELNNPNLDEKTKKKVMQMIRNRISAQNSRDRKKAYLSQLEKENSELKVENSELKLKLQQLQKQLDEAKSKSVCSVCESTSGSEHFSPYNNDDYQELQISRTNSRGFSNYSPYYLGFLLAIVLLINLMGPVPQNDAGMMSLNPQMNAGIVPLLGPEIKKEKLSENQVALLKDFCAPHCEQKICNIYDFVSSSSLQLVHKMKQHRISSNDPFYKQIAEKCEKPFDMIDYVNNNELSDFEGIKITEETKSEMIIEEIPKTNVAPYEFYNSIEGNVTTIFFPLAFADNQRLSNDFIHLLVPRKSIKPLLNQGAIVQDTVTADANDDDEVVEVIAKVTGMRIIEKRFHDFVQN